MNHTILSFIILYDVIKHLYVFNHKDLRYQIWANFHELLVDYNIPSSWMFMDCYNPPIIYTIIYCIYIEGSFNLWVFNSFYPTTIIDVTYIQWIGRNPAPSLMLDTCWKPINSAMLTTYQLVQEFASTVPVTNIPLGYPLGPSGKLTFRYGKSHGFVIGKSTISMAIFHSYSIIDDLPINSPWKMVHRNRWFTY